MSSNPISGTIFNMYKEYHLCLSDGISNHTLVYDIESHRPAQLWANIMSKTDVTSLRKNFDPWHGVDNDPTKLIERLLVLIKNLDLPVDLPNKEWGSNLQELLNCLHIHFPELEKYETTVERNQWLTEFNDIIHKLEDVDRNTEKFIWLGMLPESTFEYDLSETDYPLFSASRKFGDLCLHYPHVGRHLLEILKSRDFDCPVDQIVTQSKITAYHTLRFYDDPYSETEYKTFLKLFLEKTSLNNLYAFDDPKIAFGYINMGTLRYTNKEEITKVLKNAHFIKDWKIIG